MTTRVNLSPIGPIACALLGFAALFYLMRQTPSATRTFGHSSRGYQLSARFGNVGDLKVGSPLTIAGVKIGTVDQVLYDRTSAKALVTLRVTSSAIHLPIDSEASVRTLSPLGGKQVVIHPGGSAQYLADGNEILNTHSVMGLETLLDRLMHAAQDHGRKAGIASAAAPG